MDNKVFSIPDKERAVCIAVYSVLATAVFTAVYGYCNYLAAQATTRYSVFMDWELGIPLVPWMIYPYLSLNLLFVFSAFVVKDVSAIKGYCSGLIAAAFLAGIIFYLFPGELGFAREVVPGYENIFAAIFSVDHPHNLYPSLHVTYSSISIWTMIEQTKNRIFHLLMWTWLALIVSSVVLVHQHHLFDIVTGFVLALLVFNFVTAKIHNTDFNPLKAFTESLGFKKPSS